MEKNWLVRQESLDQFDEYANEKIKHKDQEFDQHYWLIRQKYWNKLNTLTVRGLLTRKELIKEWCACWIKTEVTLIHKRVYDYWLGE